MRLIARLIILKYGIVRGGSPLYGRRRTFGIYSRMVTHSQDAQDAPYRFININ